MNTPNNLKDFVKGFSCDLFSFYKAMVFCEREFVISKRLFRCGVEINSFLNYSQKSAYEKAVEIQFWLKYAKKNGFRKILGIDGHSINIDDLLIRNRNVIKLLSEGM